MIYAPALKLAEHVVTALGRNLAAGIPLAAQTLQTLPRDAPARRDLFIDFGRKYFYLGTLTLDRKSSIHAVEPPIIAHRAPVDGVQGWQAVLWRRVVAALDIVALAPITWLRRPLVVVVVMLLVLGARLVIVAAVLVLLDFVMVVAHVWRNYAQCSGFAAAHSRS